MIQEFVKSNSGAELSLYSVSPSCKPRGVIHISHGLVEHAGRYKRFAQRCASDGFAVFAHDLRGHGLTKAEDAHLGLFSSKNGFSSVMVDQDFVIDLIRKTFPSVPIICFGHSLGAVIALNYVIDFPNKVQALAFWNLGVERSLIARVSRFLLRLERVTRGPFSKSIFAKKFSFDSWNSKFKPNRTKFDWLSRDTAEVDKYINDPLCGHEVTISMWLDCIELVFQASDKNRLRRLPKSLPINLLAGQRDPSTNYGRDVLKLQKLLESLAIEDIFCEIIPEARHESLNDLEREETATKFIDWLKNRF